MEGVDFRRAQRREVLGKRSRTILMLLAPYRVGASPDMRLEISDRPTY